jgi:hypothetical protein
MACERCQVATVVNANLKLTHPGSTARRSWGLVTLCLAGRANQGWFARSLHGRINGVLRDTK